MLIKRDGDLLDMAENGEFDVIIHGCNCFCMMGAGIARQIADRYPEAYKADCETIKGDRLKLGTYTKHKTERVCTIINAYTQFRTSRGGDDVFEYSAFSKILRSLIFEYPTARFGLPYIGMGLANGNSGIILGIIEEFSEYVAENGGSVTLVRFA